MPLEIPIRRLVFRALRWEGCFVLPNFWLAR